MNMEEHGRTGKVLRCEYPAKVEGRAPGAIKTPAGMRASLVMSPAAKQPQTTQGHRANPEKLPGRLVRSSAKMRDAFFPCGHPEAIAKRCRHQVAPGKAHQEESWHEVHYARANTDTRWIVRRQTPARSGACNGKHLQEVDCATANTGGKWIMQRHTAAHDPQKAPDYALTV